jgi:biopolymer transport protein ExbD
MVTMADVALQIVFILFMLTTTLSPETWSSVELNLPQVKKAAQKFVKEKSIAITRSHQYHFNGVPMSPEAIEKALGDLLQGATGDERAVTIKTDKSVDYQSVVTAIDIVNRLDGQIVLVVEEEGHGSVTATP